MKPTNENGLTAGTGQPAKNQSTIKYIADKLTSSRAGVPFIEWELYRVGNNRSSCPVCSKGPKDKTLGVTIEADGQGVAHCFRCEFTQTNRTKQRQPFTRYPQLVHGREPQANTSPSKLTTLSEAGKAIWHSAHPVLPGSTAADYLEARSCALPPHGGHLRWIPKLRHPSNYSGPALVALLTNALTGKAQSLHFTWIQANGTKAAVTPPRLLYRNHEKAGSVCRLWPDEFVTHGLAVAEGIETALSVAHGFTPVWACVDAGNLSKLPVLEGVQTLLIAQDRDPAGEKAAQACALRWSRAGAVVLLTEQKQNDMNDLVQEVTL